MRIGFDVDGVLARFESEYYRLLCDVTGRRIPEADPAQWDSPATWDWEKDAGYTPQEIRATWAVIAAMPDFWLSLPPIEGADTLSLCMRDLERNHDLYFITSRTSTETAKTQTEEWLRTYTEIDTPTVLISSQKGLCAAALQLDAYIDDNLDNVVDVYARTELMSVPTRIFLLDKGYNQTTSLPDRVTRVKSVGQMLDYLVLEGL